MNSSGVGLNFTIDDVQAPFDQGASSLEDNITQLVQKIQQSGNPSQSDLLTMQALSAKFQAVIQSETAIIKSLGDMLKAVAMNIAQ